MATDIATSPMATWAHRATMYVYDNSTAEAGGASATPAKIVTAGWTEGVSSGLTVDVANDQITATAAGDYMVTLSISFSGSASDNYFIEIYKNAATSNLRLERKLGVGGDTGSASTTGIVTLAVGDDISAYQYTDTGGTVITVTEAQLTVVRLS